MPNDKEECRRAALALEHYIDRQLELYRIPVPSRVFVVDAERSYQAGVGIVYTCRTGVEVTVAFTADELKLFRQAPSPGTLEKVRNLAFEIQKNSRHESG